ncbi:MULTISPECIES: hypothetical protein [unclassified Leisingera]|uniref:hypothetical protein n=1 Tax=unclassified Leisingera TaxID=2614906 RepID=UPI0003688D22|nr:MULTISPECIES: hypothetical protein [unclassified Leisingera]KIC30263.1 hypothetical protein RA24_02795 [Leisingera sp. ANG-M6]KIC16149.1 hypothetical protein RA21_14000 [Leisingera sp. ANG-DT]KIC26011.1 hypothetical protein RA23_03425 [Leisingera sp. ANG-S3]KIC31953.1 hypothetical protein RA25_14510 [Leisingera sp. ANG-S5]KIC53261.1 hypothetical protein RA22_11430 [Leisingera sp. ANG-S]
MRTSILQAASLILPLTLAGQAALAQADPALEEAKRRLACGAGVPVSASYLPDGSLQVTCQAPGAEAVAQTNTSGLPNTGLTEGTAAAAIGGVLFIALIADGDDGTATTTTTSTGSN